MRQTSVGLDNEIPVQRIGRAFAALIQDEPAVQQFWVRQHCGWVELWLLTEPIDRSIERHLYGTVSHLYEQFPEAAIRLHLINPRLYEAMDLETIIPQDAESVPLH
ncbi:MAG: hypothetical protein DIU58_002620 [Sphaerobacter thermophilus]|uniref:Uncharacterized protein n=1 Tax=Sphaerobacter thermophilus (strain ATCC 49802 / DSM 20745 / KCCM 41009 / NCIMB 13125 / S 6022) TaxID=479434 RepID=D1C6C5_SPHTD|nr:hypothetical protein [Sphaerobacter thermophilus]ACZ37663.1 hypothetical protein Sthe_0224 [Sphaerobacter thermophilus DSM 20745]